MKLYQIFYPKGVKTRFICGGRFQLPPIFESRSATLFFITALTFIIFECVVLALNWHFLHLGINLAFLAFSLVSLTLLILMYISDPGTLPRHIVAFPDLFPDLVSENEMIRDMIPPLVYLQTDCSILPSNSSVTSTSDVHCSSNERSRPIDSERSLGLAKFCTMCKLWRDAQVHHCRICNCCIDYFDHHCDLFNKCIGSSLTGLFILMLVFLSVQALLSTIYGLSAIINHVFEAGSFFYDPVQISLIVISSLFFCLHIMLSFTHHVSFFNPILPLMFLGTLLAVLFRGALPGAGFKVLVLGIATTFFIATFIFAVQTSLMQISAIVLYGTRKQSLRASQAASVRKQNFSSDKFHIGSTPSVEDTDVDITPMTVQLAFRRLRDTFRRRKSGGFVDFTLDITELERFSTKFSMFMYKYTLMSNERTAAAEKEAELKQQLKLQRLRGPASFHTNNSHSGNEFHSDAVIQIPDSTAETTSLPYDPPSVAVEVQTHEVSSCSQECSTNPATIDSSLIESFATIKYPLQHGSSMHFQSTWHAIMRSVKSGMNNDACQIARLSIGLSSIASQSEEFGTNLLNSFDPQLDQFYDSLVETYKGVVLGPFFFAKSLMRLDPDPKKTDFNGQLLSENESLSSSSHDLFGNVSDEDALNRFFPALPPDFYS